ncbi:MAG: arginine--tRNA ligase [Bacteroidetes bacterium]|nr:arginine--tRNA ligase [Bacteroidota bacterium]
MENIYLEKVFNVALAKLLKDNNEFSIETIGLDFDIPKNKEHGDLSTNICMRLAKPMKSNPKAIAEKLISLLEYDTLLIDWIDVAGAGFINIKFSNTYYHKQLKNIFNCGNDYGRTETYKGKSVNVEYVSANPTGLLHLGHGRNAAIGDTLANLYEWTGWKVTREYYFNNAGNQMNNLAKSIHARIMQKIKDENYPFPEDGYYGDYVKVIADEIIEKHKDIVEDMV